MDLYIYVFKVVVVAITLVVELFLIETTERGVYTSYYVCLE